MSYPAGTRLVCIRGGMWIDSMGLGTKSMGPDTGEYVTSDGPDPDNGNYVQLREYAMRHTEFQGRVAYNSEFFRPVRDTDCHIALVNELVKELARPELVPQPVY